jgi:type IV pilus assembly protein PilB
VRLRAHATIYKAMGCHVCDQGYKGRTGLYQVMPVSEAMQHLIMQDSNTQALAVQAAQEGVRTLRQAGWLKVLQGITSIEEVMALTHG